MRVELLQISQSAVPYPQWFLGSRLIPRPPAPFRVLLACKHASISVFCICHIWTDELCDCESSKSVKLSSLRIVLEILIPGRCTDVLPSLTTHSNSTTNILEASRCFNNQLIIEDCGADEGYLREIITGPLQQMLAVTNLDVDLGIRSTHGFKAIFKNDDFLPRIRQRLEFLYERKPIVGLLPSRNLPKSPRFACVTRTTRQENQALNLDFDPWERCNDPSKGARDTVLTFHARGTAYIFLCEEFVRNVAPIGLSRCPAVLWNNKFDMTTFRDQRDQTYDLIYSLNHFYLGRHALDADTYPAEAFNWNECVQTLDAEDSFYNPTSMALYAYCESPVFSLVVQSQLPPLTSICESGV